MEDLYPIEAYAFKQQNILMKNRDKLVMDPPSSCNAPNILHPKLDWLHFPHAIELPLLLLGPSRENGPPLTPNCQEIELAYLVESAHP